jgi:hypothetical protein
MTDSLAWIRTPDVTAAEGMSIKALADGRATPDQQRRALAFIIERICRVDEPSFVLDQHGGDRASAYVEGRRSVGMTLRALLAVPVPSLVKELKPSTVPARPKLRKKVIND